MVVTNTNTTTAIPSTQDWPLFAAGSGKFLKEGKHQKKKKVSRGKKKPEKAKERTRFTRSWEREREKTRGLFNLLKSNKRATSKNKLIKQDRQSN